MVMDRTSWIKPVAFGSGARVFALAAQFVVLLLLSRMLSKGEFRNLMIAFVIYRLIALALGTGIGNLLLFRVGRDGSDPGLDVRLHRSAVVIGAVFSTMIAAAAASMADDLADMMNKPGLEVWLLHMAPLIVFTTLNFITMGSLEGRARINDAILMNEVWPNGLRLVLLPLVVLLALPAPAIAYVLILTVALPWMPYAVYLLNRATPSFEPLHRTDVRYASFYAGTTLASQQLQGLDMIVVGYLFTSEQAATYVIAARLAALFPFFQQIMLRNFAPRAGRLLSLGDLDTLNSEIANVSRYSMILVGGLVVAILATSPLVLPLFGDHGDGVTVLIALAIPTLIRTAFAGADVCIKMAGRPGLGLIGAFGGAAFVVATPLILAPWLGILALPLGMTLSAVCSNPIYSSLLGGIGIKVFSKKNGVLAVWCVAGLAACASATETACVALGSAIVMSSAVVYAGAPDIRLMLRKRQVR